MRQKMTRLGASRVHASRDDAHGAPGRRKEVRRWASVISISLIVAETALGQTVTLGRLLASGGGHESPLALFVATESCRYRVRVFATDVPFGIGPFVFWRFEKQIGADIDSVACPGDTVRTDDLGANHKYTWAWWTPCEAQEPTGDTYYVTGEINVP